MLYVPAPCENHANVVASGTLPPFRSHFGPKQLCAGRLSWQTASRLSWRPATLLSLSCQAMAVLLWAFCAPGARSAAGAVQSCATLDACSHLPGDSADQHPCAEVAPAQCISSVCSPVVSLSTAGCGPVFAWLHGCVWSMRALTSSYSLWCSAYCIFRIYACCSSKVV